MTLAVVEHSSERDGVPWITGRDGQQLPSNETGERVAQIASGLRQSGCCTFHRADLSRSEAVDAALNACHDPAYIESLKRVSEDLNIGEAFLDHRHCRPGKGAHMPIFSGAYALAREAAATSVEASHLLLEGAHASYAVCRPPGHHAGPHWLGGYCYLNNAMAAVEHLAKSGKQPVALLDLDFHFGDGSSAIAKRMSGVYYCSVHTSAVSEYPWHSEEPIEADQQLLSLSAAPTEAEFLQLLDFLLAECTNRHTQAIVVSLGYDVIEGDPHGKWDLRPVVFAQIGRRLVETETPICFVQEGGYGSKLLAECAMYLAIGVGDIARRKPDSLQQMSQ